VDGPIAVKLLSLLVASVVSGYGFFTWAGKLVAIWRRYEPRDGFVDAAGVVGGLVGFTLWLGYAAVTVVRALV
jgi:hypothetical protein